MITYIATPQTVPLCSVATEHKSDICEFYDNYHVDLYSIRNGMALEYAQILLPLVCMLVYVNMYA